MTIQGHSEALNGKVPLGAIKAALQAWDIYHVSNWPVEDKIKALQWFNPRYVEEIREWVNELDKLHQG